MLWFKIIFFKPVWFLFFFVSVMVLNLTHLGKWKLNWFEKLSTKTKFKPQHIHAYEESYTFLLIFLQLLNRLTWHTVHCTAGIIILLTSKMHFFPGIPMQLYQHCTNLQSPWLIALPWGKWTMKFIKSANVSGSWERVVEWQSFTMYDLYESPSDEGEWDLFPLKTSLHKWA